MSNMLARWPFLPSSAIRTHLCTSSRARPTTCQWRQVGRRSYATTAPKANLSGDLPWLAGAIVVTVPSSIWLWQQNPRYKNPHHGQGHGAHEKNESDVEAPREDFEGDNDATPAEADGSEGEGDQISPDSDKNEPNEENEPPEKGQGGSASEKQQQSSEDQRPIGERVRNEPPNEIGGNENKSDSNDEGLKQGPDDELHKTSQQMKAADPDVDEDSSQEPRGNFDKGQEGEQRGTRISEGDKERKENDPRSRSMNPYLADERKSKKTEGVIETAKITGTVDSGRKLR